MVFLLNYSISRLNLRNYKMTSLKSMLKESPLEYRRKKFVFRVIQFNEKVDLMANSSEHMTYITRLELENEMRGEYSDIYLCDKLQRREKREGEQRKRDHFNEQRKRQELEIREDKELVQMFQVVINRVCSRALQRSKRRTSHQASLVTKKIKIGVINNSNKQIPTSAGNMNEARIQTETQALDIMGQQANLEEALNLQIDGNSPSDINSAQDINLQEAVNPD